MNLFGFNKKEKRSAEETTIVVDDYGLSTIGGLLFGKHSALSAFNLSAFYACIQLISNAIASLPILIKYTESEGKHNVPEHSLNTVFKTMLYSKFTWMKKMMVDLLVHGNAYAYIERASDGTVTDIIYIPHNDVTVYFNKSKRELSYKIANFSKVSGRVEPINMIHFIKDVQDDEFEGRGALFYAKDAINLAGLTDKQAEKFFESGCNLSGILTTGSPNLSSKQALDAKASWMQTYGKNNTGGVAVLPQNWKFEAISANAAESQLLESRKWNLTEICRFFNVNPTLIGDLSNASYNTIESAMLNFVLNTLMPYIILIQEELSRKLIKPSEAGFSVDLDEAFLIRGDKTSTASYINTLVNCGVINRNEARLMLDMNPVEGLENFTVSYTDVTQNTLNKTDKNTEETENE